MKSYLHWGIAELRRMVRHQESAIDNLKQMVEALGCTNRLYFYQNHGRNATSDNELIMFYIAQGGATSYRRKVNEEAEASPQTEGV